MRHTLYTLGQSEASKRLALVEPDHGRYDPIAAARVRAARMGGGAALPDADRNGLQRTLAAAARVSDAKRRARLHGIRTLVLLTVGALVGAGFALLLAGCGGSVEPTAEERVPPPVACGTTDQPCPKQS